MLGNLKPARAFVRHMDFAGLRKIVNTVTREKPNDSISLENPQFKRTLNGRRSGRIVETAAVIHVARFTSRFGESCDREPKGSRFPSA